MAMLKRLAESPYLLWFGQWSWRARLGNERITALATIAGLIRRGLIEQETLTSDFYVVTALGRAALAEPQ